MVKINRQDMLDPMKANDTSVTATFTTIISSIILTKTTPLSVIIIQHWHTTTCKYSI